ncbi:MAG: rhomboid family intramembrane serine protease [Planctomycetes bacterium]|nr:rhomboid family intramembrane serine protease [Planctomycetota bacterium]
MAPASFDGPGFDDGFGRQQVQLGLPPLTPMTKRLLLINFGVFLATFFLSLATPSAWGSLLHVLGLSPDVWLAWFPLVPLWQLVSYGFLHDTVQFTHVLWNMLQLYFFGTMLESELGGRRFLVFYLLAMIVGGVVHLLVETATGSQGLAIGASGAVLGVVVAAATMRPNARVFLLFIPITLKVLAIVIVALDTLSALQGLFGGVQDHVAHWVHLGGAATGFVMVRTGWIRRDWIGRLEARRAVHREAQRVQDDFDMDKLLDKIHREGIGSLSRRERDFLERVSKRK